jgi:hypothetical protein
MLHGAQRRTGGSLAVRAAAARAARTHKTAEFSGLAVLA